MTRRRPFASTAFVDAEADRIWTGLDRTDWLEAFAAHPRIGAQEQVEPGRSGGSADDWASREQSGMDAATSRVRDRLASVNLEYEGRFGFIYIVCATGKSAEEMLAIAEQRLVNSPVEEIGIAAEEQRKITRLRLQKLLS